MTVSRVIDFPMLSLLVATTAADCTLLAGSKFHYVASGSGCIEVVDALFVSMSASSEAGGGAIRVSTTSSITVTSTTFAGCSAKETGHKGGACYLAVRDHHLKAVAGGIASASRVAISSIANRPHWNFCR
jgi:hypothetical protein